MSAQEEAPTQQPAPVRNETRRNALLRRQRQLLVEIDSIAQELTYYPLEVTMEEVEPIIQDLDDKKTRLFLEPREEGMENVLAVYDPTTMEFSEVDDNIDAVTIKVLITMIERGAYKTSVDLKTRTEPLVARFHVGDEHHGKTIADGMLLISSLSQATNEAQWLLKVESGKLFYSDQIANYDRKDLDSKFDDLIEQSEFSLSDLEGYYLFVGDTDKLTKFLKPGPVAVPSPKETSTNDAAAEPVELLEASTTPSTNYLAKLGPQGRIRHHYSTQELKKMAMERGLSINEVMGAINDMAIERADDPDFVYVHFRT